MTRRGRGGKSTSTSAVMTNTMRSRIIQQDAEQGGGEEEDEGVASAAFQAELAALAAAAAAAQPVAASSDHCLLAAPPPPSADHDHDSPHVSPRRAIGTADAAVYSPVVKTVDLKLIRRLATNESGRGLVPTIRRTYKFNQSTSQFTTRYYQPADLCDSIIAGQEEEDSSDEPPEKRVVAMPRLVNGWRKGGQRGNPRSRVEDDPPSMDLCSDDSPSTASNHSEDTVVFSSTRLQAVNVRPPQRSPLILARRSRPVPIQPRPAPVPPPTNPPVLVATRPADWPIRQGNNLVVTRPLASSEHDYDMRPAFTPRPPVSPQPKPIVIRRPLPHMTALIRLPRHLPPLRRRVKAEEVTVESARSALVKREPLDDAPMLSECDLQMRKGTNRLVQVKSEVDDFAEFPRSRYMATFSEQRIGESGGAISDVVSSALPRYTEGYTSEMAAASDPAKKMSDGALTGHSCRLCHRLVRLRLMSKHKHIFEYHVLARQTPGVLKLGCRVCRYATNNGSLLNLKNHMRTHHPDYEIMFSRSGGERLKEVTDQFMEFCFPHKQAGSVDSKAMLELLANEDIRLCLTLRPPFASDGMLSLSSGRNLVSKSQMPCNECGKLLRHTQVDVHIYEKHALDVAKMSCPFCAFESDNGDATMQHCAEQHALEHPRVVAEAEEWHKAMNDLMDCCFPSAAASGSTSAARVNCVLCDKVLPSTTTPYAHLFTAEHAQKLANYCCAYCSFSSGDQLDAALQHCTDEHPQHQSKVVDIWQKFHEKLQELTKRCFEAAEELDDKSGSVVLVRVRCHLCQVEMPKWHMRQHINTVHLATEMKLLCTLCDYKNSGDVWKAKQHWRECHPTEELAITDKRGDFDAQVLEVAKKCFPSTGVILKQRKRKKIQFEVNLSKSVPDRENPRKVQCGLCEQFAWTGYMLEHVHVCHMADVMKLRCSICDYENAGSLRAAREHIRTHAVEAGAMVIDNRGQFDRQTAAIYVDCFPTRPKRSWSIKSQNGRVKCAGCDQYVHPSLRAKVSHILRAHIKKAVLRCSSCAYESTGQPNEVKKHIRQQHPGEKAHIIDTRHKHRARVQVLLKKYF